MKKTSDSASRGGAGATTLLKPAGHEEAELLEKLDPQRLPSHIAAIMDGNGRWARKRHLPRVAGHRAGVKTAREIIETCARLHVPCLTLYAFSQENWRRPQAEVDFLMRLLREYLKRELPAIHKNNIRLLVIGRSQDLPEAVRADIADAMRVTAGNTGMKLVVALNYGGRAEMVDAFNALLKRALLDGAGANGQPPFRVDEQAISEHLYTAGLPDPDLLIRTSGEMRVSNFLLWQIAYAEIYVTETLWPDFSRARLLEALVDFQKRERRYGGLGSPDPVPRETVLRHPALRRMAAVIQKMGARNPTPAPEFLEDSSRPMRARILTAMLMIPAVVALVWWGPALLLAAVAAVVAILALSEFFDLAERAGLRAYRKWTMFCAAGIFYAQYSMSFVETRTFSGGVSLVRDISGQPVSIEIVLLVFLFGAVGVGLASRRPLSEVLPALAGSAGGILLVALPLSYLVRVMEIEAAGRKLLLFTLCLIWAGDMLAYFVGRSLGRFKMAPALSPNKTWEGALANVVASLLIAVPFARWTGIDTLTLLDMAALANIAGQMGDLIESAYKRGAGVKDSSALLPGHGGMLDRIDSLILASPVVWVVYQLLAMR